MANTGPYTLEKGCRKWTLDTTATIYLGDAADGTVGTFCVQAVDTGDGGEFYPIQRVKGSGLSGSNLKTTVWYESDASTEIAAGTAKAEDGIFYILSDGLDTYLEYTASTGSKTIYVIGLAG